MADIVACPECSQVGLAPNVCEVCGHRWYAAPRSEDAAPLREALERIADEVDEDATRTRHPQSCPTAFKVFRAIVQHELEALAATPRRK